MIGASIAVMGKVAITPAAGVPTPTLGAQDRRVLAALVLERHRPVSRDDLADVVWDGEPPASWAAALRGVIARLRRVLASAGLDPETALLTEHGGYHLVLPQGTSVDLEEASAAHAEARLAMGRGEAGTARDLAEAAAAIASQPLLPDVACEWIDEHRREAGVLLVHALELAADAALSSGDPEVSVAHAEAVVALDPYRESAHRLRMQGHADAGNPAAALRAYEECRNVLAEELGVSPSGATDAVYAAVLAGSEGRRPPARLAATAPRPPRTSAPTGATAVPRSLRHGVERLIGRAPELAALSAEWRAASAGEVRAVLVTGEPGIGKTRLVAELATVVAAEGATVLHGRCQQDAVVPYQPFVEVIRQHAQALSADELAAAVGVGATELCRLLPELADLIGIDPPPGGVQRAERHHLLDAVAVLLTRAAATSPVLIVVDDLHWADTATLVLVQHLLHRPDPAPLLLVGTFRDTDVALAPDLARMLTALEREPNAEQVRVSGLDGEQVGALISTVLDRCVDEASVAAIHRSTRGNPLFVDAVVRHLVEQDPEVGAGRGGGPLVPAGSLAAEELAAPHSVRRLITQRLTLFDEPVELVLTAAAVIGPSFDPDLLAQIVDLPVDVVLDAIDLAICAGLLAVAPDAPGRFGFVHDLVRHALYDIASHGRRARLHAAAGEALERRGPQRNVATLALLAHHFGRSGTDLATAAGYSRQAGEQAMVQLAYEDAATHFRNAMGALAWTSDADGERAAVLVALGGALSRVADNEGARAALLEAVDAAREIGDRELLGQAVIALTELPFIVGRSDPALVELLEEAVAAVDDPRSAVRATLLSRLHQAVTWDDAWRGRTAALAEEAVEVARRSGDDRAQAVALARRWAEQWAPVAARARLETTDEMVARAVAAADPPLWLHAVGFRIMAQLSLGEIDRAEADLEAARAEATRLQLELHLGVIKPWASLRAVTDGRLEDAERLATEGLAAGQQAQNPDAMQTYAAQLIVIRREQGRLEELNHPLDALTAQYPAIPIWSALHAFIAAERGDLTEAAATLDTIEVVQPGHTWLSVMALLSEVALALGATSWAEQLYAELAPHDHVVVLLGYSAGIFGPVADLNGGLAALLGRWDDAVAHHERALAITACRPRSPGHVRSRWRYGTTLLARGGARDAERAAELLGDATATATATGMARLAGLASESLGRMQQGAG